MLCVAATAWILIVAPLRSLLIPPWQATWRAALAAGEVAEGDAVAFVGTHGPEGDGDGDLKEFLEKFGT